MIKPNQIKAHRKSLGLTQAAYAARYGVSHQQVRLHWEKEGISDRALLKARRLVKLAKEVKNVQS